MVRFARLLPLLCWAATVALVAQEDSSSPPVNVATPTCTLEGVVANSITGEPIPRALVASSSNSHSVLTDTSGEFHIAGVQAGQDWIVAQKPGFLDPRSEGGHSRPKPATCRSADRLVLKLTPEAVIFGRLTGDNGEPVEHAQIEIRNQHPNRDRKRSRLFQNMTSTDEDGGFRFANLPPGSYFLHLRPELHLPSAIRADGKRETGYAYTWYPGNPDAASSAPVRVEAGQKIEADIALRSEPLYQVSGKVTGNLPGSHAWMRVMDSGGEFVPVNPRYDAASGTFEIVAIPPGAYLLRAESRGDQKKPALVAELPLSVSQDKSGVVLALRPALTIPVLVRTESASLSSAAKGDGAAGEPAMPPVSVQLTNVQHHQRDYGSYSEGGGNAHQAIHDVEPGTYEVRVYMNSASHWVESVSAGSLDLQRENLVVAPGSDVQPIEVLLRNDPATIEGTVNPGNNRLQSVAGPHIIVAAMKDGDSHPKWAAISEGGATGVKFAIPGLAPGKYRLFAFEGNYFRDDESAEELQTYAGKATSVSVEANDRKNVSLDLMTPDDE